MKTTLDLPDELMRTIRVRAAQQNRKINDVVVELLRRGLVLVGNDQPILSVRRVQLPLVQCEHPAHPDREMTPDRVAATLLSQEADCAVPHD